jgi:hypothetical protein
MTHSRTLRLLLGAVLVLLLVPVGFVVGALSAGRYIISRDAGPPRP